MQKSNFSDHGVDPVQARTRVNAARKYTEIFMKANVKSYSQWFLGKRNNVTDALSWEWQRTNNELTQIRCSLFPNQMPDRFEILPLPSEISSWLISLLQQSPVSEQLREEHMMAKLDSGDDVVQAFRTAGRQNPTKDDDHELSILLSRQFRAYKNEDPQQKQQKALPFIVLDELAKRQMPELDIALSQLTIGAAFFACRSCEYLIVSKTEERLTKLLCLRNIRFFKDGHLISAPSASLKLTDSVAITFEMQKNDDKFETVIHGQTDNPVLCPVLQWARLVNHIWSYEGTT